MLDIKYIRENPDRVKIALTNRQKNPAMVDDLLTIDIRRRDLQSSLDEIKAQKNKASKEIISGGNKDVIIAKMQEFDQGSNRLEAELKELMAVYEKLLESIPNIPSADTPVGKSEEENVVLRTWGERKEFDFEPLDHAVLGERLDLIDSERAVAASGSRFSYLKNELVLMEFGLLMFGMQVLMSREKLQEIAKFAGEDFDTRPFMPILPPDMLREDVYRRVGRLNDENQENMYAVNDGNLRLVGSAEHTLLTLHLDETLDESRFPVRYVGFSTAFRREAGTYGKDMKGILRQHQFDKLEMLTFGLPEYGEQEHRFFVAIQEYVMQKLGLPYQVIGICTGDMGPTNVKQTDINAWIPAQGVYRETHTSDYNGDYQARGMGTKVKRKDGTKEFVHTNDGTVFSRRPLIAILENYQQKDGSVRVPDILVPYVGKEVIRREV